MDFEKRKAAWIEFVDEVGSAGVTIYAQADFTEVDKGAADPRVVALALLCRSLAHIRAVVELIEKDLLVEARTITRCCYENLMWIDGLAAGGDDFVMKVVKADYKQREQRGKIIMAWGEQRAERPSFMDNLQKYLERIKEEHPDRKPLPFKAIADGGVLRDSYVIYGQLSTDAAHPSTDSLSRHIERTADESLTIVAEPPSDPEEVDQTLGFAIGAVIGICVGTNQILGSVPAGAMLGGLFEKYVSIRDAGRKQKPEELAQ